MDDTDAAKHKEEQSELRTPSVLGPPPTTAHSSSRIHDDAQQQMGNLNEPEPLESPEVRATEVQKLYGDAIQHYTEAVKQCPDCIEHYANRSFCLLLLHRYDEAIKDAERIVELDSNSIRGWNRLGQCYMATGNALSAMVALQKAHKMDPKNKKIQKTLASAMSLQESLNAFLVKDYQTSILHLQNAQKNALVTLNMRVKKAECLCLSGFSCEASAMVDEILHSHGRHTEALYVKALCLYHQDYLAAAVQVLLQVLGLQPDHEKAKTTLTRANKLISKLKEGSKALSTLNIVRARSVYTEALAIDADNHCTNSKLLYRLSRVEERLGLFDDAVSNFTRSLQRNDRYLEAYFWRGVVYKRMGRFEKACGDFEKVIELRENVCHREQR